MHKVPLTYLAVLVSTLVLDGIWLGAVARRFYADRLGYLMAPDVQWWAAASFYALFAAGVLYFVVLPLATADSLGRAFVTGGFFGLVAYATYDLTSQAIIRNWPLAVTVVDLVWGTALTGTVSVVGAWSARWLR